MQPTHDRDGESDEPKTPAGTWALLLIVAASMALAWLFLYFGVFLPRGAVH